MPIFKTGFFPIDDDRFVIIDFSKEEFKKIDTGIYFVNTPRVFLHTSIYGSE